MAKLLRYTLLYVTLVVGAVFFTLYGSKSYTFYGDALGYYLYLPATFIYQNLDSPDQLPKDKGIDDGVQWHVETMRKNTPVNEKIVIQYTYGVALLESPFFFAAHAYEKVNNLPALGFSGTYNFAIKICTLTYAILGLLLVYFLLTKYFPPGISLTATLITFMCTNLFWFSLYQAGMAHVPLFFLYALLLSLTVRLHTTPRPWLFALAGLTTGLITIIRPVDMLCMLIPLMYGVYNKQTLLQKATFLKQNKRNLLIFTIISALPALPQLMYWKMQTGAYLYYSYGDQSFNWSKPKIMEGLFHFSNGWLPYCPVMFFALAGLLFFKNIRNWAYTAYLILPLYVYIIYSWYCYNYINGLGSRPMIHLYPLLAIPLTAFVFFISRRGIGVKFIFTFLCLFFAVLNISYSIQQHLGILDSAASNMAYNRQILFRTSINYKDLVARDVAELQPDTQQVQWMRNLQCQGFDVAEEEHRVKDSANGGGFIYHMKDEDYGNALELKYSKAQFEGAKWIKCSGRFMCPLRPNYFKHMLVLDIPDKLTKSCAIENKIFDSTKHDEIIKLDRAEPGKWGTVYFFVKVPNNLVDGDIMKLFVWNTAKTEMYMDNLCIDLYK